MRFEVIVRLKPEVLDPEARAVKEGLNRRYSDSVNSVSISKRFELDIDSQKEADALKAATEMAKTYLANPVSESFEVTALENKNDV